MKKPKIEEISSREYEKGRVDRFFLSGSADFHKELISTLRSLDVSEKNLGEFDFVTSNSEGYFFVYDKGIRIHLVLSDEGANLIVDSKIPKEELVTKMGKFFKIF